MKKPILLMGSAALFLSALSLYFSLFSSTDLVYVDVNKLIDGYQRAKETKKQIDKKAADAKATIDTLMGKWQQELQQYEKDRASLSPRELKLKQELLANKQHQINAYQQAIQKQVDEEGAKVTQTVINDINDYLKEYGKKHNHKIIFGASGSGNIMYAAEETDLTEDVLKGLNAQYAKK